MQKGPELFCDVCEKQLVGFTHFELADRKPGQKELRHFCSKCALEIFDFILELKEQWSNFNTTVQDAVTKLAETVQEISDWQRRRELLMPTPQVEDFEVGSVTEKPNALPIIGEKKQEPKDEETTEPTTEEGQPPQEESADSSPDTQTPDTSPEPDQGVPEPTEQESNGVSESRDPFADEEDSGGPEKA
ncbi:hypothetical protein KAR91_12390 [Candidatus Pacearchaeota archaeon]|nr:hypothetical protein [Candidatus Pacearchaeota archaeon]